MNDTERLLSKLGVSENVYTLMAVDAFEAQSIQYACDRLRHFYRDNEGLFGSSIDEVCSVITD